MSKFNVGPSDGEGLMYYHLGECAPRAYEPVELWTTRQATELDRIIKRYARVYRGAYDAPEVIIAERLFIASRTAAIVEIIGRDPFGGIYTPGMDSLRIKASETLQQALVGLSGAIMDPK
jgi:hypothetical protein